MLKSMMMWTNADSYFGRSFSFQRSSEWKLPSSNQFFQSAPFVMDAMRDMKATLNSTKSKLDDIELTSWHQHTRQTNPTGDVTRHLRGAVKAELCTQAWAKFHEIVSTYRLVPDDALAVGTLRTVHLCEAPGAFVASLNHYLKSHCVGLEWQWMATTLNPFYEGNSPVSTVAEDQFIIETLEQWDFGRDNSGDVMKWTNVISLCERVDSWSVQLVTADGSVDCQDVPAEQESHVAPLHYCETVAALTLLGQGGSFVIKMFTLFEHQTICLLYLLCCAFEQVNVTKPATSKGGNSEVYVVCLGYKGRDVVRSEHLVCLQKEVGVTGGSSKAALFPESLIAADALEQIVECARTFMSFQTEAIERNLRFYYSMNKKQEKQLVDLKKRVVRLYMAKYKVKRLERDHRIVKTHFLDGRSLNSRSVWMDTSKVAFSGSFRQRQERRAQSWQDKVTQCGSSSEISLHPAKRHPHHGVDDRMQEGESAEVGDVSTTWLQSCDARLKLSDIQPVFGATILKVLSSPFCCKQVLNEYLDAIHNAKVLCSDNMAGVCKMACTTHPYYAFKARTIPYFLSGDGLDMAVVNSISQLMFSGSFVDLSGRHGGYTSYLKWMFPKAKIHFVDYEEQKDVLKCDKRSTQDVESCEIHRLSSIDSASVNRFGEAVMASSGHVDVVIGDAGCVAVSDCPPFRKEIHTKQVLLSHCIIAFKVLRLGGFFICRLFDSFTRVTAAVLFILHKVFDEICVVKPRTSCPVTADRFVVCKGFQGCDAAVIERLLSIMDQMDDSRSCQSVVEIVPITLLLEKPFCEFLITCNENLMEQITQKIIKLEYQFLQPAENMGDDGSDDICTSVLASLDLPAVRH